MELKYKLIMIISPIVTVLFGEFDVPLQTLILFMGLDWVTGLLVAGVFKSSLKSDDGRLSSHAGLKGIIKKGVMLFIVLIAYRLDLLAGTNIVRNTVITAFIVNEVVSINENAALMGIDVPKVITDIIKSLKR